MKRLFLYALFAFAGTVGKTFAQDHTLTDYERRAMRSKTEKTFNVWDLQVNIRSTVTLKEGKMILELQNVGDYANFMNMDSVLQVFRKDIAFYKDSLETNNAGHVRIDYVMSPEYSFKKIRFKKYNADGDIFVNRTGDISRLKLEQDTVHIIIEKLLHKTKCNVSYSIQATFILDNYTDVDKIIANRDELHRIMDTIEKESHSPKENKKGRYPEMTISYNPYHTGKNAMQKKWLGSHSPTGYLTLHGNIGTGIIMNTIAPTAELGLVINSPWGHGSANYSFFRLYVSGHYFFERNADAGASIKDNYFVNFSLGSEYEKADKGWVGKVGDFGVGYLAWRKGNYFKGTTMKVFTDIKVMNGLTLSPEIISTNNFKQFFPGITLKIF